jgi:hypothetical protein
VEEKEGVVAQHVEGTTFPTIPEKQMEEVISRQQHVASFTHSTKSGSRLSFGEKIVNQQNVASPRPTHSQQLVRVDKGSTTIGKIRTRGSRTFK